jgi:hypothetical protein
MSITPVFTPVPRQSDRHDGWTEQKQRDFLVALGDYGVVRAAAEKVGMGTACAYRLRHAEGAESFALAWDQALAIGMAQLQDIAMDRAVHGVAIPQFYKGQQVGETRWYDNRLLMFMLRQTNTRRFGAHAAQYDFVDEVRRVEAAEEAKRLDLLARAESMIEQIDGLSADYVADSTLVPDDLIHKRARLSEFVQQLRDVDTRRAKAADLDRLLDQGRLSPRHVRQFKKQMGLGP